MDLKTPLSALPGVGYSFVKKLKNLELNTVEDLLNHYPFRYDDFSNLSNAIEVNIGEKVTLTGEIWSIKNIYTRTRKILTQAVFHDGTSPIELTWFNQRWLINTIKAGDRLQISGKVSKYKNKLSIVAPVWEKVSHQSSDISRQTEDKKQETLHTGRLVPVYSETFGLTSRWMRTKVVKILDEVLGKIEDPLPESIRDGMLPLGEAIKKIHLPENYNDVNKARERLGFDELFFIQLATQRARMKWQEKSPTEPFLIDNKKIEEFIKSLPFELTGAQKRVISEITEDLTRNYPMNRLVQGEVGSGKTVVAAVIAYIAHLNKLKTLFMAPTEVLAFQHFSTLTKLLESYGINVGIYTGSKKFTKNQKADGLKGPKEELGVKNQEQTKNIPEVVVGTHALLSDKLNIEEVGLIIVDEQQRFGVEQRTILRNRAKVPHFLTMTATPIPRTIALTIYGDLEVSVIDELPKNRQLIKTYVVPEKKREDAYAFIEKQVKLGDQVYIITPLIEESETIQSVKAATSEFNRLSKEVFPKLKLGLLHGRLSSKEKSAVLDSFKNGKINILVSTTVVEVGVDVPNATIMVIEGAERFGLAQLHQLRGRVGRGSKSSYCLLFSEDKSASGRLKNLEKIYNGLELAELDMKIRGSGEVYGVKQSGRLNLKIADFSDLKLITLAREKATKILQDNLELDKYPQLRGKLESLAREVSPD